MSNLTEDICLVPKDKLGCNFQDHNKNCFALVLNIMEADDIFEQYKKWNFMLRL